MKPQLLLTLLLGFTLLTCASCSSSDSPTPPQPTATREPLPSETLPPSSPTPTVTPIVTSTQKPLLPTPTPYIYTVKEGDTLYGIASRFDTTIDEIVAANPELTSNVLSIGAQLVIPAGEGGLIPDLPTPTPVPISISKPICYPTRESGLWCFISALNDQNTILENVSAILNLHKPSGEIAASEIAIPPINLLQKGSQIPLSAYFPPPLPDTYQVFASLLTALPSDSEIKPLTLQNEEISFHEDHRQALVTGQIDLENADQTTFKQIWVVAIAFDDAGQVVGMRKWVRKQDLSPELEVIPFEFYVYSLGPPIAEVNLLTEHY